jgi:hypothetical protein
MANPCFLFLFFEEAPTAGFVKPTFGKLQFRHGSSARYDSDFAKDQPWVKIRGKSKLQVSLVLSPKLFFVEMQELY